MSEPLLELRNVWKSFGRYDVLKDLNLSVGKGEIVGLLGPNGSGKTTTLRIATGYAWSDKGQVLISGRSVFPNAPLSRIPVGYLPEKVPLYDPFRVSEYLHFLASVRGFRGQRAKDAVQRVLYAFNLSAVEGRLIGHLSKGFRQRIGLAQALLSQPKILLLDEPTNGLDPGQLVEARDMIRRAAEDRAVIFSTHIMQEVSALCTRVVYLLDGNLRSIPLASDWSIGGTIKARVRCETIDTLLTQISQLSPDIRPERIDQGENIFDLELNCSTDIRGELSALFVTHGDLLSFQSETLSLEKRVLKLLGETGEVS
jgi:ABC-type multidrug transport system ATPase subunit